MIKCIVFGITLCLIDFVVERMKRNNSKLILNDSSHFIVRYPKELKLLFKVMFFFGMILFLVFCYLYSKGNLTVEKGHLVFALVFSGIGVLLKVLFSNELEVVEEKIIFRKVFRKQKEVPISYVKTRVGKEGQISLYLDGKKYITIDPLSENFEELINTLRKYENL